ncbi:hypothetical protein K1X84_10030 [bacterium]|nr:hypothetical protein [bacterium]
MKKLIMTVLLVLIGCAPSTRFISPEYDGKTLVGKTIVITPLTDRNLFIENTDDVKDDLGDGNARSVYTSFFDSTMTQAVRKYARMRKVRIKDFNIQPVLESTTFTIGKDKTMEIALPQEGQTTEFDSTYDFVLFIGRLDISRYAGQAGTWIPGPKGGGSTVGGKSPALLHKVTYAIWDNEKGKIVCYGQFDAEASFAFAMTRGTWVSAVETVAYLILEESPFFKRSY